MGQNFQAVQSLGASVNEIFDLDEVLDYDPDSNVSQIESVPPAVQKYADEHENDYVEIWMERHVNVWGRNGSLNQKILNAEKEPRFEPFVNRTPLVCPESSNLTNEVGTICNPCGVRCTGIFFNFNKTESLKTNLS